MNNYEQCCVVLSRGLGGVHGDTLSGGSITYYDTRLQAYLGELVEGGYVIDHKEILSVKPGLAVSSPMVNGSLPAGEVDRLGDVTDSIVANAIAGDNNNPMAGLAKLAITSKDKFGGFDFVAPDVYAAWWLEHGARVGQRFNNFIVWSTGKREKILPFKYRYSKATY